MENEEKRNSGEVEKQTKPQTTVINTVQNAKPPSKNGISRAGNQAKLSDQTTATKSVSVTKVESTQQNGSVPLEKDPKTSKVTVTFSPTKPASVNGESDKKSVTNGGGKSSVVKNNGSSIESSFKSSVSVKPSSSQLNPENNSKKGKEPCISNSSKSAEPAVVKADPKLLKSTAPTVVYHMGRPMAVDQNLGKNRDQVLADIRNFKRKSEPVKPVEKDVKQIFSSATSNVSGSSNGKDVPSSPIDVSPSPKDVPSPSKDLPSSSEEEVDSGSGSVEGSPEVEKFVSSFSFTQKTHNAPVSAEKPTKQLMDKGKTTLPVLGETVKVKGSTIFKLR